MKLAVIIILLMAMLNLIPPLFANTVYFDNVYYIIMYLLLSFLGFSLPFMVESLNKQLKRISTLLGSWFFGGVLMELFNLSIPSEVLNSNIDNPFYFKVVICFVIGLFAIMSSETWSKQKKY